VQVGDRHVKLGAFSVLQGQELGGLIVDFQCRKTEIPTDAVIDVHHRRAFAQLGEVFDDSVVIGVGAFFAATALHDALTE